MLTLLVASAWAWNGYYRQPDLHGDTVVFAADGDLWTVPVSGGTARQLTANPGHDGSPFLSPDGALVAYTSDLDGGVDVYVVPVGGGEPRRLTWHPAGDETIGWTPDGEVLFRSSRNDPHGTSHIFRVPAGGGEPVEVAIGWASRLDVEAGTGRHAFTRHGREGATWKRYRGGSADDIWVGDPRTGQFTEITTFEGADGWPMWSKGRLVFLSDRGGTANLWSMAPDGSGARAVTTGTTWDVRTPAAAPDGRVIYTLAADVWIVDPATGVTRQVPIDLPGERRLARARYPWAVGWLESASLSPDGTRLAIGTRGELFSVPVDDGVTLPLTLTSGARERAVSWRSDGESVLYVTDASGELAVEARDAWGRSAPSTVLAPRARGWIYGPWPSPDDRSLAWSDEIGALWVAPQAGGAPVKLDESPWAEIREVAWSHDGRYLAWTRFDERELGRVRVWDSKDRSTHDVGSGTTSDFSPAWDPSGRYLFWLSSRTVNPMFGARDFQAVEVATVRPYVALLRPDVHHPFADNAGLPPAPENPAPQAAGERAQKEKDKRDKKRKATDPDAEPETPSFTITWDGLNDRVIEVPVSPGNYHDLSAKDDLLFWLDSPAGGPEDDDRPTRLMAFDLDEEEASEVLGDVGGYALEVRADKLLVLANGELWVLPASAGASLDEPVSLYDLHVDLEPQAEWSQILREVYRYQRDFFWDPAMGGVDWKAEHARYATLLPRLASRSDLLDLIGELIGELGTSHTYAWGGDGGRRSDLSTWGNGTLGCEVVREGAAFRITRILRGDPADRVDAPLLEPGVGVREGMYILAVQRHPIDPTLPFEAHLAGLAGRRVVLTINSTPSSTGARDVAVDVLWGDSQLRYVDWVRRNREAVAAASDGKLGYLHIPDMGMAGLIAFETWAAPQANREGLVIDVRHNRGGFVSQILLEKLRRPVHGFVVTRTGGYGRYPDAVRGGPFVVLTDGFAGSDGDIFPRAVQLEGLAPVIGERSWGGVIGIRMDKSLVDGGAISSPEYAFWFREGGWGVENRGVVPDQEVMFGPGAAARGDDVQLTAAIRNLLQRLDAEALPPFPAEPRPRKDRGAYGPELP
jgi:tricorn protease